MTIVYSNWIGKSELKIGGTSLENKENKKCGPTVKNISEVPQLFFYSLEVPTKQTEL